MRENRKEVEIAIVGGGPAGLSTWLHLNALAPELAAKAVVFEKATYPRDKLCGGGVTALGDLLLRGMGIGIECPSVEVHRIEFRFGSAVESLEQRHVMRVVRRRDFDHALAQAAVDRGLDLRQGEEFVAVHAEEDGLDVRTNTGEYRVRVLIGADGAHSPVRHALGLDGETRLARLIEMVAPVDTARAPEFRGPTAVFDFGPMASGVQGYTWQFPCLEGGTPAVNRGIYDSRIHPERDRADLRSAFADALAMSGIDSEHAGWKSHPVRWFSGTDALSRPNAFLVGDAAGVDALLGEGIAPSLDYGDFAAHVLIDAFSRGEFGFATLQDQLLAHPVGRLLKARALLAERAYSDDSSLAGFLPSLLAQWAGGPG